MESPEIRYRDRRDSNISRFTASVLRSGNFKKSGYLVHRYLLYAEKTLKDKTVDRGQENAGHRGVLLVFTVHLLESLPDDRPPALVFFGKTLPQVGILRERFLNKVHVDLASTP